MDIDAMRRKRIYNEDVLHALEQIMRQPLPIIRSVDTLTIANLDAALTAAHDQGVAVDYLALSVNRHRELWQEYWDTIWRHEYLEEYGMTVGEFSAKHLYCRGLFAHTHPVTQQALRFAPVRDWLDGYILGVSLAEGAQPVVLVQIEQPIPEETDPIKRLARQIADSPTGEVATHAS